MNYFLCPICVTQQQIVGSHDESYYDASWEFGYRVYDLACGHDYATKPMTIGRAPDDRYAGRPTVRSHRPQDLADSREATTE